MGGGRMKILGLDLSLTKPGIAYGPIADTLRVPAIKGVDRLSYWRDTFKHLFATVQPDVVVIEGYSFGSQGQSVVQIAELGGLIRLLMADTGIVWAEVAPATLKKYATGKGNSGKEQVTIAAVHRAGREFPDNNAADAWWLMQMGLAHYTPGDARLVEMPIVNRGSLTAVKWPDVAVSV